MDYKVVAEKLKAAPVAFLSRDLDRLTDGMFTTIYAGFLRSSGKGPKFHRLGRRIVYRREDFLQWVEERLASGAEK